jgi:hypothetical protein
MRAAYPFRQKPIKKAVVLSLQERLSLCRAGQLSFTAQDNYLARHKEKEGAGFIKKSKTLYEVRMSYC